MITPKAGPLGSPRLFRDAALSDLTLAPEGDPSKPPHWRPGDENDADQRASPDVDRSSNPQDDDPLNLFRAESHKTLQGEPKGSRVIAAGKWSSLHDSGPSAESRPEPVDETAPAVKREPISTIGSISPHAWYRWRLVGILATAVAALAGMVFVAVRLSRTPPATGPAAVEASAVTSRPATRDAGIDGSPTDVALVERSPNPASHGVQTSQSPEVRAVPGVVGDPPGVSQPIDLQDSKRGGRLLVRSEPPGARVTIDGRSRGVTPLTVADLPPGKHTVSLEGQRGELLQTVTIEPGATVSLIVPFAGSATPEWGWIAVSVPIEMDLFESGRLLGTSRTERIMVPVGSHELEFVNDALAYRSKHVVQVHPGAVATLRVELPDGVMHINAVPWAEVWIDGDRIGETPLGNLTVGIGRHEIIFRHPQLGEQRRVVTVGAGAPTRLSVDLSK